MTLRDQLNKKRDELAVKGYGHKDVNDLRFKAGADAMLALLMPCVEALEFYENIKNWTGPDEGEDIQITDTDCYRNTNMNDDLFGGLTALKALTKLREGLK